MLLRIACLRLLPAVSVCRRGRLPRCRGSTVHPCLRTRQVRSSTDGNITEPVPLLQGSRLIRPDVTAATMQWQVPAVDVHGCSAPSLIRCERVGIVQARDGAGGLVRRSGTRVLTHDCDHLRRRRRSAVPRRDPAAQPGSAAGEAGSVLVSDGFAAGRLGGSFTVMTRWGCVRLRAPGGQAGRRRHTQRAAGRTRRGRIPAAVDPVGASEQNPGHLGGPWVRGRAPPGPAAARCSGHPWRGRGRCVRPGHHAFCSPLEPDVRCWGMTARLSHEDRLAAE